jgi:hypothetical protein
VKLSYAKLLVHTLAISLLAALLAGCGGSQEQQGSDGGQGSQGEESAPSTSSETTGQAASGAPGGGTTASSSMEEAGDATPQVVAATERFLATLDDAQSEQATFAFDDPLKSSNWSNLPAPLVERSGVAFGNMTEEQQQAAMAVLEAALSE